MTLPRYQGPTDFCLCPNNLCLCSRYALVAVVYARKPPELSLLGLTSIVWDLPVLQAVHTLEDVGDSELPALAGGEVLRTVKIINKEVRLASKVARTGMERLREALTTVSCIQCCTITHCAPWGTPV